MDQFTALLVIFGFIILVIFIQLLWIEGLFESAMLAISVVLVFWLGGKLAKIVFDKWSTEDPIYNLEKKW